MTDLFIVTHRGQVGLQKHALDVSLQRRNAPTNGRAKDVEIEERPVTQSLRGLCHLLQAHSFDLRMPSTRHQLEQT